MARAYLIIVVVGVAIGAIMPSDWPEPARDPAGRPASDPALIVAPAVSPDHAAATMSFASGGASTMLERDPGGHFFADAQVNGVPVRFLVDTGATGVALTTQDAQRVGLPFFPGEFTVVGRGASGDVRGKLVTLDRVSLGDRGVERVGGAIIEGGDISLLGQSFLSQMGTIEINGDRMTIR